MKYFLVLVSLTALALSCASQAPDRSDGTRPSVAESGGNASVGTGSGGAPAAGGALSTQPPATTGGTKSGGSGGNPAATGTGSASSGGTPAVPALGGAGGSSPTNSSGGSTGVSGELNGLRWEALCRETNLPPGSAACPNTPTDNVCPIDPTDPEGERMGYFSTDKTVSFPGTPGVVYDVNIRVRGVVELRDYQNGTNGGEHFYIGGSSPDSVGGEEVHVNLYSLQVSAPAQIYYLNHDGGSGTGTASSVAVIDQMKTIPIEGGATVRAIAFDRNCNAYMNCESYSGTCTPWIVPGVPPYPNAFSGQFLQLDVISVTPKN